MTKIVKISDITRFADSLARSIRANLQWSTQLRKAVVVSRGRGTESSTSITITIGENKRDKSGNPLSGMARAYEYGSGEHATRGLARKYAIYPKNKKALWFPFPIERAYRGVTTYNGGIVTKVVHHPGVRPRPFLSKAIQSTLMKATEDLKLDIRRNIVDTLNISIRELNSK